MRKENAGTTGDPRPLRLTEPRSGERVCDPQQGWRWKARWEISGASGFSGVAAAHRAARRKLAAMSTIHGEPRTPKKMGAHGDPELRGRKGRGQPCPRVDGNRVTGTRPSPPRVTVHGNMKLTSLFTFCYSDGRIWYANAKEWCAVAGVAVYRNNIANV
jgi:hypothetical protein